MVPPKGLGARRRRPLFIVASILLIVLSAGGAAALFAAQDHREKVLAVARPVAYGQTIQEADLREVQWTKTTGIRTIPAAQRTSVVGKRAAVNLIPDSLLNRDQVTDTPVLQPGQVTVAVALTTEQMPVRPLAPGQRVQLVTAAAKNSDQPVGDKTPATGGTTAPAVQGTIVQIGQRDDRSGKTVLEVAVSAVDGPGLAQRLFANQIAVLFEQPGAGVGR